MWTTETCNDYSLPSAAQITSWGLTVHVAQLVKSGLWYSRTWKMETKGNFIFICSWDWKKSSWISESMFNIDHAKSVLESGKLKLDAAVMRHHLYSEEEHAEGLDWRSSRRRCTWTWRASSWDILSERAPRWTPWWRQRRHHLLWFFH